MKKLFGIIALLSLSLTAWAQKNDVRVQDTQARFLDITSNAYVKPLTVELKVDLTKGNDPSENGRIIDTWPLTKVQAEQEMGGDIANIRSWAVYQSSRKHKADVIVAATFNFRTNDAGTGYEITVVGYPANFVQWKTADETDYEWIRMEKVLTTADRDKIDAVIKK